jgi:hypothetical protein
MSASTEKMKKCRLCFSLLSESGNKINLFCNKTQPGVLRGISAQAAGTSLCALCSSLCEISRRNQKSEEFLLFCFTIFGAELRCEHIGCSFLPKIKLHHSVNTKHRVGLIEILMLFQQTRHRSIALYQEHSFAGVRFTTKVKINQSLNPSASP